MNPALSVRPTLSSWVLTGDKLSLFLISCKTLGKFVDFWRFDHLPKEGVGGDSSFSVKLLHLGSRGIYSLELEK